MIPCAACGAQSLRTGETEHTCRRCGNVDTLQEVGVLPIVLVQAALLGAIALGAAIAFPYLLLTGTRPLAEDVIILSFTALALFVLPYMAKILFQRDRYRVQFYEGGLRIGAGDWIPYHRIDRLRQRSFMLRLDLLDRDNRLLGSLEHQLESFDVLIEWLRQFVLDRPPTTSFPRRFGPRSILTSRLLWVIVAGGVWGGVTGWLDERSRGIIVLAPLAAVIVVLLVKEMQIGLDIDDDEVVVHYAHRQRRIPRGEVAQVLLRTLGDHGGRGVRVVLVTRTGRRIGIRTAGADDFELYRALRAWHSS